MRQARCALPTVQGCPESHFLGIKNITKITANTAVKIFVLVFKVIIDNFQHCTYNPESLEFAQTLKFPHFLEF